MYWIWRFFKSIFGQIQRGWPLLRHEGDQQSICIKEQEAAVDYELEKHHDFNRPSSALQTALGLRKSQIHHFRHGLLSRRITLRTHQTIQENELKYGQVLYHWSPPCLRKIA